MFQRFFFSPQLISSKSLHVVFDMQMRVAPPRSFLPFSSSPLPIPSAPHRQLSFASAAQSEILDDREELHYISLTGSVLYLRRCWWFMTLVHRLWLKLILLCAALEWNHEITKEALESYLWVIKCSRFDRVTFHHTLWLFSSATNRLVWRKTHGAVKRFIPLDTGR